MSYFYYLCTGGGCHLSSLILTNCAVCTVVGGYLSTLYLSICAKVLGLGGHQSCFILSICAKVVGAICLVSCVYRWQGSSVQSPVCTGGRGHLSSLSVHRWWMSSFQSYFNYLCTGGGCHLSSLILTIFSQVVDVIFLVLF